MGAIQRGKPTVSHMNTAHTQIDREDWVKHNSCGAKMPEVAGEAGRTRYRQNTGSGKGRKKRQGGE